MAKTNEIVIGIDEVKVQRLTVPFDLKQKQYLDLRMDYMQMIVSAKKDLKKAFDIYKDELSKVLSLRRKLTDAEDRLVEVFDRLSSGKLSKEK